MNTILIKNKMNNKVFYTATLLCTYLFCITTSAQVKELTLKDAINYALENKAEAKKSKLDVENSNYQIEETRSKALPQIAINSGLTYNPILQLSALPGDLVGAPGTSVLVAFGQKWNANAGASLTQNIFDLSVFTGLKAAKTTREFYLLNAELTDEQVIENVAKNYYQVYVQRQKLVVIDSNYINTTKIRNIIAGQYESGLAKRVDLSRMNVNLSNIKTQRQQLINAIQLQENALKFYIGMPISTPINLAKAELDVQLLNTTETVDSSQLTQMRALKTQEQLLVYQKKSVMAGYYPTLSLTANYSYQALGNNFPLFATGKDGVNWFDVSSIGLNLKIPVFTGFGTRAKVRQADVALRAHRVDIENTKLILDRDFEDAKAQIINSVATIENQRENVKLGQEVYDDVNSNYQIGLATLTDLLDAETSYIQAQNNYTTAQLEYKLAELQLLKSKGELKTLQN